MDYETRVSKLIALHFSGLITECEEEELQNLLRENPTTATLFLRLREDDMFRESYLQQKKWDVEKAILKFDTLSGYFHVWRITAYGKKQNRDSCYNGV